MTTVAFSIPGLKLESESNTRDGWRAKAYRTKVARHAAEMHTRAALSGRKLSAPIAITLWRVGPRRLDPGNCEASFKAVQDGVADALGIDDGDPRLTWRYEQASPGPLRPGERKYRVEVIIKGSEEP
jgi:hypothetical protein